MHSVLKLSRKQGRTHKSFIANVNPSDSHPNLPSQHSKNDLKHTTFTMDKLKKMFGGNKDEAGSGSGSASAAPTTTSSQQPMGGAGASSGGSTPEGVILHTTLGDITIALYSDQTPKVRSASKNT